MDEIFEKILLNGFGLKLNSSQRIRTCLICSTNGGIVALKKHNCDSLMVEFESEARNTLVKNGFENVNRFILSVEENACYTFSEANYTLEPYVPLSTPDMESEETVLKAVDALARMHRASFGLEFDGGRSGIGRLPELFKKRISELRHIRKDIARRGQYDIMDMVIKNNYKYFYDRAQRALLKLTESGYHKLSAEAGLKKSFCHNSFKSGNFMLNQLEEIFVDSMAKCAYDIPVLDVAYFIRRMMKEPDFDERYARKILYTYQSRMEFGQRECSVVEAMLLFPWKFMSLCNEYYNKRRNYCLEPASERFIRCIEASPKEERILDFLDKYV